MPVFISRVIRILRGTFSAGIWSCVGAVILTSVSGRTIEHEDDLKKDE